MSRTTAAVLLSALVLPGAGQFYLRRHLAGALLAGIALAALYVVASVTLDAASAIVTDMAQGAPLPRGTSLEALLAQRVAASGSTRAAYATAALLLAWVLGVVDAWRAGRRLERPPA